MRLEQNAKGLALLEPPLAVSAPIDGVGAATMIVQVQVLQVQVGDGSGSVAGRGDDREVEVMVEVEEEEVSRESDKEVAVTNDTKLVGRQLDRDGMGWLILGPYARCRAKSR